MSRRYAPTLLVGLGGSGMAVLRYLKRRTGLRFSKDEPLVYLGVDLDQSSRFARLQEIEAPEEAADVKKAACSDADPAWTLDLADDEQQYFDPKKIENCIRNLNREYGGATDEGRRFAFDYIRNWFPGRGDEDFRGAQVTASGARQWRPLGRVGFFLNVRDIVSNIGSAARKLGRLLSPTVRVGDSPMIYLISSLAGGTGSGMLHDVAANLRRELPDYPLLAFLILPEVFSMHTFTDNIEANAYAALQEIAHLKNQHIQFDADYGEFRSIKASESIVLYQRVYLLGPWVRDARPFRDSEATFPHFADLLLLSLTREMRADMISTQANAAGDSGRLLTDPASKNVFSEMTTMGIHLLSYERLAEQCLLRFADEIVEEQERPLVNLWMPAYGSDGTTLDNWLRTEFSKAAGDVATQALADRAGQLFDTAVPPGSASPARLRTFVDQLESQLSLGNDAPPQFIVATAERLDQQLGLRIAEERRRHRQQAAYLAALDEALKQVVVPARPGGFPTVADLKDLKGWHSILSIAPQTVQSQYPRARASLLEAVRQSAPNYAAWQLYEAAWRARARLQAAKDADANVFDALKSLCDVVIANYADLRFSNAENDLSKTYLDCSSQRNPFEVFATLHSAANEREREEFVNGFNDVLNEQKGKLTIGASAVHRRNIVDDWLKRTKELVASIFGKLQCYGLKADSPAYRFLSPRAFITDEKIRAAVGRCITPLFQDGRLPPTTERRTVRVLVPPSFAKWDEYLDELMSATSSVFTVPAQRVTRGMADEDRIVIVVENLFRPSEAINGIYDYYHAYARRPHQALFHVDKRWLDHLDPIITRAGAQGRIACGNSGCKADLRDVDRAERFCPGCGRPIRNRCGNRGCLIDDLASRHNLDQVISSTVCPGCRGPLRTYWWHCDFHGEVPMDKPTCPACVAEGRAPHVTFQRPDLRERFVCPSCVDAQKKEPYVASGAEKKWLLFGVNGHEVVRALRTFGEHLSDGRHCKVCGTVLVPFCPIEADDRHNEHFLYRDAVHSPHAPYRCYEHLDLTFRTCFVCKFSVGEDETHCRRCRREVRECRFCTPHFNLVVPVSSDTRCPNCRAHLDASLTHNDERPDDVFCSNIFGCPIGARLDSVSLPKNVGRCPICEHDALRPLDVQTRTDHVRSCPFCSTLFPRVVERQLDKDRMPPWSDETNCCLCGMNLGIARALTGSPDFATAQRIAFAFMHHTNDEAAFTEIYQGISAAEKQIVPQRIEEFLRHVTRPAVAAVLRPRLEHLLQHWRRLFNCRVPDAQRHASQHRERDGEPSPDSDGNNNIVPEALDLNSLLRQEKNISDWLRVLKRSGVRLESLPSLQAFFEAQTTDPVTLRRIRNAFKEAADLWDMVEE